MQQVTGETRNQDTRAELHDIYEETRHYGERATSSLRGNDELALD
jgi:hypothetical protein